MVFCQIDNKLLDILHEIADGRRFIDLGAGECLFEHMYRERFDDAEIISVELYKQEHLFIPRENVTRFDAVMMAANMRPNDLPIFIRPCHSDQFMPDSLRNMQDLVPEAIYISKKENVIVDIPEDYEYKEVLGWKGEEGESIFRIKLYGKPWVRPTREYFMVTLPHFKEPIKMYKEERFGEMHFVNDRGGGFPCDGKDVVAVPMK
jgi:hypothetical protein